MVTLAAATPVYDLSSPHFCHPFSPHRWTLTCFLILLPPLWGRHFAAADSSHVLLSIVKPRMTQDLNHLPIQSDAKGDIEYGLGRQAGVTGRGAWHFVAG